MSANQHLAGPETAGYHEQLLDLDHWHIAPFSDGSDMSLSIRRDVP